MTPRVSLRRAFEEAPLLGETLGGSSWARWRILLLAARGELLLPDEAVVFRQLTGGREPPTAPVHETLVVAGRRGGKSRAMAAFACYLAGLCDHRAELAKGERGHVLLIAPDTRQAKVALDYCEGIFESTPVLNQLIAGRSTESLSLTTGVDITVRAARFRSLRGMTCVAVLADEAAFWMSDESANPDTEILAAARPTLATTGGPLLIISSPYARRGEVYDIYRRHYGPEGDPAILVAQGASRDFNPGLSLHVVERALKEDPARARAEYLGEFRSDIEGFVNREAVEACVEPGCFERAPRSGARYVAFVDPSGGRGDAMTLAIAHAIDGEIVLDAVRERQPPFSPEDVVAEFAETLRLYGVREVVGDRYAGEWPREVFRRYGVEYRASARPKSELYRDLLPSLNSGLCRLVENERLLLQLVGLERRTSRGGRETIDHPPGAHDDLANAVAGALVEATRAAISGRGESYCIAGYGGSGAVVRMNSDRPRAIRIWGRGPGLSAVDGRPNTSTGKP